MSYYYNKETEQFVKVDYDLHNAVHPRKDFKPISKFYTWEREYLSPDENPYRTIKDFLNNYNIESRGILSEDLEKLKPWFKKGVYIVPVERYEHGNIKYSLYKEGIQCRWDTGLVGFMVVKESDFYERFVKDFRTVGKDYLNQLLRDELAIYNKYVNSEVYYMSIYNKDGELEDCISGYFCGSEREVLAEEFSNVEENFEELGEWKCIEQCIFRFERRNK